MSVSRSILKKRRHIVIGLLQFDPSIRLGQRISLPAFLFESACRMALGPRISLPAFLLKVPHGTGTKNLTTRLFFKLPHGIGTKNLTSRLFIYKWHVKIWKCRVKTSWSDTFHSGFFELNLSWWKRKERYQQEKIRIRLPSVLVDYDFWVGTSFSC